MTDIDPRALRSAFGAFLTGVTVVTTVDPSGTPVGFTANSFSSVSLDPPLLLVCPGKFLNSFSVFEGCDRFAVNILAEGQEAVSNTFASFKGDRFAQVSWSTDANGVPIIDGTSAHFSCQTAQVIPAGDHIVLMGKVVDFGCSDRRGLGYASGRYFSLGLEREAAAPPDPKRRAVAGVIIERDGKILLQKTADGMRPPQFDLGDKTSVREALVAKLVDVGLSVSMGKAYSIFEDRTSGIHYTYFQAHAEDETTGDVGSYISISDLPTLRATSDAHSAMLKRFALEYETRSFGLYVGDEIAGDIHGMDERN